MKKVSRVSVVIILAAVAAVKVWTMGRTGRPHPSYHGKPLSYWFRQYCLDLQPWLHGSLDSNEALDPIVGAGSAGIPYLAEELKSQGSASSPVLIFLWSKLPAKVQQRIPRPLESLQVKYHAIHALERLGDTYNTVIPPLLNALKDANPQVRSAAISAVGRAGHCAPTVLPILIGAFDDPNPGVTESATLELAKCIWERKLPSSIERLVPAFVNAVQSTNINQQVNALSALAGMGTNACAALPLLLNKFRDEKGDVQEEAAFALGQIDPAWKPKAVQFLVDKLEGATNSQTKWRPIYRLGSLGADARPGVPALVNVVRHEKKDLAVRAIDALGEIGPAASQAIPVLVDALNDPDENMRLDAAFYQWKIDPRQAEVVVPALAGLLKGRDFRWAAAYFLGLIGPQAKGAIPALTESLGDPDIGVRGLACHAIYKIEPQKAGLIVPVFTRLLSEEARLDNLLRHITILGEIGTQAGPAMPVLIQHLNHGDPQIRLAAAKAVLEIDRGPTKSVIGALAEMVRRKEHWYRPQAVQLLGSISLKDGDVIPILKETLHDAEEAVRREAAEALRKIDQR